MGNLVSALCFFIPEQNLVLEVSLVDDIPCLRHNAPMLHITTGHIVLQLD